MKLTKLQINIICIFVMIFLFLYASSHYDLYYCFFTSNDCDPTPEEMNHTGCMILAFISIIGLVLIKYNFPKKEDKNGR